MDIIEVKHLSKQFSDVQAVDDVSFSIREGELFGFLGPKGAGKTTTINMLTGLARPDAGRITIAGIDVNSARQIRRLVGDLKQAGTTIFLTTHYIEEAERLCDRIAFIVAGRIVRAASDIWGRRSSRLGARRPPDALCPQSVRPRGFRLRTVCRQPVEHQAQMDFVKYDKYKGSNDEVDHCKRRNKTLCRRRRGRTGP